MMKKLNFIIFISLLISTQINEVALETAALANNAEECPSCSEMLAYSKKDYFFE